MQLDDDAATESQLSKQESNWAKRQDIHILIQSKWPAYLVEIIVIIIGISISFLIDSIKENSAERQLERTYLHGLVSDIERDIDSLEYLIKKNDSVIASVNRLLVFIDKRDKIEEDMFQYGSDVGFMLRRPKFYSINATFLDLKSGNLQMVKDSEIRKSLFLYYTFVETIYDFQETEEYATINLLQPYLYKNFYIGKLNGITILLPNATNFSNTTDKMFINIVGTRKLSRVEHTQLIEKGRFMALELKKKLTLRLNDL